MGEPGTTWDRVLAAAEKLNSWQALVGLAIWGTIFVLVNVAFGLRAATIPLFALTLILAAGTGVALEKVLAERKTARLRPVHTAAIAQRVRSMYVAAEQVALSDGAAIQTSLVNTWHSYSGELITVTECDQRLDETQKVLIRAQRRVAKLIEAGSPVPSLTKTTSRPRTRAGQDLLQQTELAQSSAPTRYAGIARARTRELES